MRLEQRIEVMVRLGEYLKSNDDYFNAILDRTYKENNWFTIENQQQAIQAIANYFLDSELLHQWLSHYTILDHQTPKTVGLIMAGNIPMVGFHDVLTVFLSGHRAMIKLSEKDKYVLPHLIKILNQFNKATADYFQVEERLRGFDAVIATGSNNSARYFESYFGKYPNIIRKNRNSIAILEGTESFDDLVELGKDIFQYFGLGCRNVSKIYVPKDYNFELLLEALHEYKALVMHSKYKNNFDYHYAIYIINRVKYLANGCIMLREAESLNSPVANLHYEFYDDSHALEQMLLLKSDLIQVIVSKMSFNHLVAQPFGQAQYPNLWDYADGVDTMKFLLNI
jgi:hypothetical protein